MNAKPEGSGSGRGQPLLFWPRLLRGTLIRRYQRFLADVKLRNARPVTAHCPNSGSMLGCSEPGRPVYISRQDRPGRKLRYTWELIEMPGSLVGINTMVPNRLVRDAAAAGAVPGLDGFERMVTEVSCGDNSRIDLLLESGGKRCYVEVKNCTLVEGRTAYFPDAVTARGLKHLRVLQEQVRRGHRAVMFYLVQRMDADRFRPADHVDPAYGQGLRRAADRGVEILVYDTAIDLIGIRLRRRLPWEL